MSRLGTWADHIIIQAVANANNLRINITESEPNFSESTTVCSIYAASETHRINLRDIYVGHLEELHYVSTMPIRPTTQSIPPTNPRHVLPGSILLGYFVSSIAVSWQIFTG